MENTIAVEAPPEGMRSTREVFDHHLHLAKQGAVEEDLRRNYANDVKVLTRWGVFEGHDGIRELAARLAEELPEPHFEYTTTLVVDEIAYLEWTATSRTHRAENGADTFLIQDGKVQVQTIHYTLRPMDPE
jgi:hypothetical protein